MDHKDMEPKELIKQVLNAASNHNAIRAQQIMLAQKVWQESVEALDSITINFGGVNIPLDHADYCQAVEYFLDALLEIQMADVIYCLEHQ